MTDYKVENWKRPVTKTVLYGFIKRFVFWIVGLMLVVGLGLGLGLQKEEKTSN